MHGWGAGAFRREYRAQEKASDSRATAASHTIPVTVAAEQGIIGLAVYLALLAVALARLRGAGLSAGLRSSDTATGESSVPPRNRTKEPSEEWRVETTFMKSYVEPIQPPRTRATGP